MAKRFTKVEKGEIQEALWNGGYHDDNITFHADKTVTVRDSYFYRHGRTTDRLVSKVKTAFPQARIVDSGDHWAEWPKLSYYYVRFEPVDPDFDAGRVVAAS